MSDSSSSPSSVVVLTALVAVRPSVRPSVRVRLSVRPSAVRPSVPRASEASLFFRAYFKKSELISKILEGYTGELIFKNKLFCRIELIFHRAYFLAEPILFFSKAILFFEFVKPNRAYFDKSELILGKPSLFKREPSLFQNKLLLKISSLGNRAYFFKKRDS